MLIKISDVWKDIVDYYYKEIQPERPDVSIWEWINCEYNGNRSGYNPSTGLHEYLLFEDDIDATAFKLKFLVTNEV